MNSSTSSTVDTHAVRSRQPNRQGKSKPPQPQPKPDGQKNQKTCGNYGGEHSRRETCPAKGEKCNFCKKKGHYQKVCRQKKRELHDIETSQDSYTLNDVGSITFHSINHLKTINSEPFPNKIFAKVKLNDSCHLRLKVDTGSDTCILTQDDIKKIELQASVQDSNFILYNYGGSKIPHIGTTSLKISYRGKSTTADFRIVKVKGNPYVLGCRQSLDLEIITLNYKNIQTAQSPTLLTREKVISDFGDCFDKIGKFPGEKILYKAHQRLETC